MDDPKFGAKQNAPPSWFARVPTKAIMDSKLTHADLRVLAAICIYANNQGFAWPNKITIKDKAKCSQNALDRGLAKLKKRGYIKVVSRHRSHPKWRRVMGCVYRIVFDEELETDKLIDQMHNEDVEPTPIVDDAPSKPIEIEKKGIGNHDKDNEVRQLAEARGVARWFAKFAESATGQFRIVDDRAIAAAMARLEAGMTVEQIKTAVERELVELRNRRQPAPHHLGDCDIA